MNIKSLKVSWSKIGMSQPFEKRTIHYFFSPKIEYEDGKINNVAFNTKIEKKDFKEIYLTDSYFVVKTKSSVFIFDAEGDEKSEIPCKTLGTVLWVQADGVIFVNENDLLKFDIDGKITRQCPAKDFLNEEAIEDIKKNIPDAYEKLVKAGVIHSGQNV